MNSRIKNKLLPIFRQQTFLNFRENILNIFPFRCRCTIYYKAVNVNVIGWKTYFWYELAKFLLTVRLLSYRAAKVEQQPIKMFDFGVFLRIFLLFVPCCLQVFIFQVIKCAFKLLNSEIIFYIPRNALEMCRNNWNISVKCICTRVFKYLLMLP